MSVIPENRRSLLSSTALVQAPWIKVTIGDFTFGVMNESEKKVTESQSNTYISHVLQYPNYVKSLSIVKINGQINQYTLNISYPVRAQDDPNFFEKVFSSASRTRKIVFSYGDASQPAYAYKDEEAIITKVQTSFGFGSGGTSNSVINYTISAVSSASLGQQGCHTFFNQAGEKKRPSVEIRRIFNTASYGLQEIFTGMGPDNLDQLIAGDDKEVELETKTNISPLDYITYLVGCMVPEGTTLQTNNKDMYALTIRDDTTYEPEYSNPITHGGPYFKVERVSYTRSRNDAYEVDIGFNTGTIVTNFSLTNNQNYSMYYDYTQELYPDEYVRRISNKGEWEDVYSPAFTSRNHAHKTRTEDITYYSKLTRFPVNATITLQGLLRPATLMTYLRLNVIFPGGGKHISSGLYIVTKQVDNIDQSGYRTTLSLVKIDGDDDPYFEDRME